jgi:hypothetical protein
MCPLRLDAPKLVPLVKCVVESGDDDLYPTVERNFDTVTFVRTYTAYEFEKPAKLRSTLLCAKIWDELYETFQGETTFQAVCELYMVGSYRIGIVRPFGLDPMENNGTCRIQHSALKNFALEFFKISRTRWNFWDNMKSHLEHNALSTNENSESYIDYLVPAEGLYSLDLIKKIFHNQTLAVRKVNDIHFMYPVKETSEIFVTAQIRLAFLNNQLTAFVHNPGDYSDHAKMKAKIREWFPSADKIVSGSDVIGYMQTLVSPQ